MMPVRTLSWLLLLGALVAAPARAQFSMVPLPELPPGGPPPSQAAGSAEYKRDAAQHVYASYASRVYKGKLPPLLFGIAIVETHVEADGRVASVSVLRPPAAREVGPWIVDMIRRAGPFPAAGRPMRFQEIWLVDKSGRFQLDTLTEGQL